jgi:polyvinyl alcohol dehydrogenase (cytochrome)
MLKNTVHLMNCFRQIACVALCCALSTIAAAQHATPPAAGSPYTASMDKLANGTEMEGMLDYLRVCANCHGRIQQAPSLAALQRLPPEAIYTAVTTGAMKTQAAALSDRQKAKVAEWLSGRRIGATDSGDAQKMSNRCARSEPLANLDWGDAWNGWSPNPLTNARFQPVKAAGISPAATARLQLRWAFGLPGTSSAYGQPTVVGGRIFIGSDSGYLYALDAQSGCVYWSFHANAGLRSAPMLAPVPHSSEVAVFFGDVRGHMYAVNASDGKLLWTVSVDTHPLSRIVGAISVFKDRVYVPVANLEEDSTADYDYKCCTSRGVVVALDAATGKEIWKTYTIPDVPTARKTPKGVDFMGPSGASVWGALTLDPKRHALYLGTGNGFSEPDVGRSDAVMALDMNTGAVLWVQQVEHDDIWQGWCNAGPAPAGFPLRSAAHRPGTRPEHNVPFPAIPSTYYCPDVKNNPDYDFSAGQMLVDLPDGHSLVVAGQKSGLVWAFDPDKKGAIVWKSDISRGEITFGAANDGTFGYFGLRGGALAAVRLSDGVEQWGMWIDPQASMHTHRGVSAAVTVVPGVVFVPCLDGTLRAYSTFDGRPIWQYDTTQKVQTVNGVAGKGGSLGSAGATVVNGMVYVSSGYIGYQGGQPGNLLLAFGAPTK